MRPIGSIHDHGTTVAPETSRRAFKAVSRIADRGEPSELWAESEDGDQWRVAIANLQVRLAGGSTANE